MSKKKYNKSSLVLPIIFVVFLSILISFSLWQIEVQHETNLQQNKLNSSIVHLGQFISNRLNEHSLALQRMADRWVVNGGTERKEWEADALNYYNDLEGLHTLEWVDASYVVRWVMPVEGNEKEIDFDLIYDADRKSVLDIAINNKQATLSSIIELKKGRKGFLITIPIFIENHINGFILAVYDLKTLLDNLINRDIGEGYIVFLKEDNKLQYQNHQLSKAIDANALQSNTLIRVMNKEWEIIGVKERERHNNVSTITVVSSVLISFLLTIIGWYLLRITYLKEKSEITEEKMEEALIFSELVMANIPDLVFVKDSEFKIVQANPAFLNVYPESIRDNVIGTTTIENYNYEEAEKFLENDRKALAKGYNEVEEKITFPDGEVRTLFSKKVRFENVKGEQFILGVSQDISKRKEAEKKLITYNKEIIHQKEYYESLIYNLNIPTFVMNVKHEVVIWNKACEEMTGMLSKDVVGTKDAWKAFYDKSRPMLADIIIDDEIEAIAEMYPVSKQQSFIQGGRSVENWNPLPLKNKPSYVAIDAGPIYDEAGKVIAVVEVIRDITELKRTQIKLEQRQKELQRSNEELERFAYVASHDLQEPLRMVASYTNLLAKRYQDKLDDDANDFINFAVDGAKRMQTLIEDLLSFSRLNSVSTEMSIIDTDELVGDVIDIFNQSIDVLNHVVITKDKLPEVQGQESTLKQLFQNLITNAIKYSDPERKNEIHVSVTKQGNMWEFSVSDKGIGISPEFFEKIFIIFKRLHSGERYSGTGIGLALCKKIVEQHGGKIWVESVPGEGSNFIFTLREK